MTSTLTRTYVTVVALALGGGFACANMPGGMDLQKMFDSSSEKKEESTSTETSESSVSVNGREIEHEKKRRSRQKRTEARGVAAVVPDFDDDDDDDDREDIEEDEEEARPRARKSRRRATIAEREIDDIGATCKRNDDCQARACWVGRGELGYCTKMCNSWSDCPSHWECKKPGNAPQKICMQDDG